MIWALGLAAGYVAGWPLALALIWYHVRNQHVAQNGPDDLNDEPVRVMHFCISVRAAMVWPALVIFITVETAHNRLLSWIVGAGASS